MKKNTDIFVFLFLKDHILDNINKKCTSVLVLLQYYSMLRESSKYYEKVKALWQFKRVGAHCATFKVKRGRWSFFLPQTISYFSRHSIYF